MAQSRLESDIYVTGNLGAKTFAPPAGCIDNTAVKALAGIAASKLQHQHAKTYSQPNTTATTETRTVHVVYGATGIIVDFRVGSIVANIGAATVTVDLKKNGTTVLSAVVTLNSSSVAYIAQAGTITVPGLVVGDVLTIVITATAGGGTLATGVFCHLTVQEDAQ